MRTIVFGLAILVATTACTQKPVPRNTPTATFTFSGAITGTFTHPTVVFCRQLGGEAKPAAFVFYASGGHVQSTPWDVEVSIEAPFFHGAGTYTKSSGRNPELLASVVQANGFRRYVASAYTLVVGANARSMHITGELIGDNEPATGPLHMTGNLQCP
jgi:hypothetical protein